MGAETMDIKHLIAQVADGRPLSTAEAERAFDIMMSGDATPSQMGGLLMALRVRGETVEEITGAAKTMRSKALHVAAPEGAMDIVGTGGDGVGTYNISTATALVVAGCGVTVAKHGNRAFSSKSGAADVLTALGLDIEAPIEAVQQAMAEAHIGFLMAPRHHGAMRNVGPTRVELGTRTIFNILGPLSNPALVKRYLLGVFAERWIVPMAETLRNLGAERAWVVHGADGLDELSTTGVNKVAALRDGAVATFDVAPEDAGLPRAALDDLRGGEAAENAAAIRALLGGQQSPFRDVVLLNAAAALVVAEKAEDLTGGVAEAAAAIDDGRAQGALDALVKIAGADAA